VAAIPREIRLTEGRRRLDVIWEVILIWEVIWEDGSASQLTADTLQAHRWCGPGSTACRPHAPLISPSLRSSRSAPTRSLSPLPGRHDHGIVSWP
jgi:hypothetical protein